MLAHDTKSLNKNYDENAELDCLSNYVLCNYRKNRSEDLKGLKRYLTGNGINLKFNNKNSTVPEKVVERYNFLADSNNSRRPKYQINTVINNIDFFHMNENRMNDRIKKSFDEVQVQQATNNLSHSGNNFDNINSLTSSTIIGSSLSNNCDSIKFNTYKNLCSSTQLTKYPKHYDKHECNNTIQSKEKNTINGSYNRFEISDVMINIASENIDNIINMKNKCISSIELEYLNASIGKKTAFGNIIKEQNIKFDTMLNDSIEYLNKSITHCNLSEQTIMHNPIIPVNEGDNCLTELDSATDNFLTPIMTEHCINDNTSNDLANKKGIYHSPIFNSDITYVSPNNLKKNDISAIIQKNNNSITVYKEQGLICDINNLNKASIYNNKNTLCSTTVDATYSNSNDPSSRLKNISYSNNDIDNHNMLKQNENDNIQQKTYGISICKVDQYNKNCKIDINSPYAKKFFDIPTSIMQLEKKHKIAFSNKQLIKMNLRTLLSAADGFI